MSVRRARWADCAECGRRLPEHFMCPHHDRWLCSMCCGCDPDRGPVYDMDAAIGRALGQALDVMGLDHHQTVKADR